MKTAKKAVIAITIIAAIPVTGNAIESATIAMIIVPTIPAKKQIARSHRHFESAFRPPEAATVNSPATSKIR